MMGCGKKRKEEGIGLPDPPLPLRGDIFIKLLTNFHLIINLLIIVTSNPHSSDIIQNSQVQGVKKNDKNENENETACEIVMSSCSKGRKR
jgi:hypothetical protein